MGPWRAHAACSAKAPREQPGYAFGPLRLHRLIAVTDAKNTAAATVLERLGLRREGHLIENVFFKGAWGDEFQYALLGREWTQAHPRGPEPGDGGPTATRNRASLARPTQGAGSARRSWPAAPGQPSAVVLNPGGGGACSRSRSPVRGWVNASVSA
ncbi:hypothetical protein COSO111634_12490 [Corallococcus soli]